MVSTAEQPATLLDGNVLIALSYASHVHHQAAHQWFEQRRNQPFATSPITQGTLVRVLLHCGAVTRVQDALNLLQALVDHPNHRFWPDTIDYLQVDWKGVLGHRQVTDAYLAALARSNGGRMATFDQGLAALHPDVAELIQPV